MAVKENYTPNIKISGTSSNDSISNYANNVTITSGKGKDTIFNNADNVIIKSGSGNDSIRARGNNKTIEGGTGNDWIAPNGNNNLILYNAGDGNDTIWAFTADDTLSISGVSYSTQASGNDLIVKVGKNTIALKDAYAYTDTVHINKKSIALKRKAITAHEDEYITEVTRDSISVVGTDSDNYIDIYGSKVTISGGKGNDSIALWDSYPEKNLINYTSGDGNDTISGFNEDDTLSIGGGSYSTKKSGDNVIVTVGKGKISLIGAASLSKVNIKGTKATSTTTLTVTDKTKSPVTVGSAIKTINASKRTTAVKITGNSLANTITGGSKNDTIYGKAGNDSILGNAGNDKLYGGKGNDTLTGGKGNDSLWGNAGKDTFIYAKGDGKDVIYGFDNTDMLKITGTFAGTYNKSKKEVYFKVGSTANAITLKDFGSTSTFNVNGTNYKISGSKLVKK